MSDKSDSPGSGEYDVKDVVNKMAHIQNRRIENLETQNQSVRVDLATHKVWAETVIHSLQELMVDMRNSVQALTKTIQSTQTKVGVIMGVCSAAVVIVQILQYLKK